MVAEGRFIPMNTAFMLLTYLGMAHLEVLAKDSGCWELYYWSFFDVKLGYSPCIKKYYLKSYPGDPKGNIENLLKYVREFRKMHNYQFVQDRRETEHRWYKAHTDRFGDWKEVHSGNDNQKLRHTEAPDSQLQPSSGGRSRSIRAVTPLSSVYPEFSSSHAGPISGPKEEHMSEWLLRLKQVLSRIQVSRTT